MKKQHFKQAFYMTLPVMAGYLFLGCAFGILFQEQGYGPLWAALMSLTVYAGSLQFAAVGLFAQKCVDAHRKSRPVPIIIIAVFAQFAVIRLHIAAQIWIVRAPWSAP